MTFDDPGEPIFDHLDDPAPPTLSEDALTGVVRRGQQIRRRRRSAYALTSGAVAIVLAGSAIAIANSGGPSGRNGQTVIGSTPSPTQTGANIPKGKNHRHHGGNGPGTQTINPCGTSRHAGQHAGHHHHKAGGGGHGVLPPPCVTATPAPTPTMITPTPSGSQTPTPVSSTPTPVPVVTCAPPAPGGSEAPSAPTTAAPD
jgi:hypothetical protein